MYFKAFTRISPGRQSDAVLLAVVTAKTCGLQTGWCLDGMHRSIDQIVHQMAQMRTDALRAAKGMSAVSVR